MAATNSHSGVRLAGSTRLKQSLDTLGVLGDPARDGLVYDASNNDPSGWGELEEELTQVFRLTQRAVLESCPIVYVLHEPSIWGHEGPFRSALATALLGGMRSAAVELARTGIPANALALGPNVELDQAASSLDFLLSSRLSGQLITCGTTHLGRPAA